MTTSIRKIQILMFCLALACAGGMSRTTLASDGAEEQVGSLTVTGTVKVNGKPAATGDTVAAGSEVQTATGSSALVSLGKLGRIEVLPSTTMKLRYDVHTTSHASASIAILLGDGSIKVSAAKEGMVNVETDHTATRASLGAEKVFTVDKTCGNTLVSVAEGKVELRFGHTVKHIAAGSHDTDGQAKPGCTQARNR
jgi:ferric-dicitrate binding protein FerR (iron transport regulator)